MKYSKKMFNKISEEELKEAFLNFCEELGSAAEECQKLLDEYFDMAYSYLLEALTPDEFCAAIGLCQQTSGGGMNSQEKAMNKVIMKLFPSSEQQKEAIADLLDYICDLFPASEEQQCKAFIDTNRDIIIKFLAEDAAPEVICHMITLCSVNVLVDASLTSAILQEELRQLLEGVCRLFPGESKKKCLGVVDTYFNLVMSMILQEFTPDQICKQLGFCPSSKQAPSSIHAIPQPTKQVINQKVSDSECDMCVNVVQFVYSELKDNATEEEIKLLLDKACSLFPGETRQKCINMVNTYFDMLVSLLTQQLSPDQICQALGFCANCKYSSCSGSECDMCITVVQYVYSQLKNESTEEEIKLLLDKACSLFPGETRQKCINMVNTYFDMLVSLLTQQLSPDQICQAMGFCSSSKKMPLSVHPVPQPKAHFVKNRSGAECDICINVVQFVYNELKDNGTEEEIKQLLDKACSLLPGSSKQKCIDMVNNYLDMLVALIIQQLSPDEICQTLGFCPSSIAASPVVTSASHFSKQGIPKVTFGGECEICKNVVQFVYNEMKDKSSEEEVKKLLDGVCNLFAETERQECVTLVNTYLDVLVPMLLNKYTPTQICQSLHLCPNARATSLPSAPKNVSPKKMADPDPECEFCQSIVKLVHDELKDEKTEAAVKKVLNHVCDLCPTRQKCITFVNTYYDRLVSLLLQEMDPNVICKDFLHLCSEGLRGNFECTFCNYALHFIQNQLVDNVTEARVQEVLDKLCDELPEQFADECRAFVEEYGPALMVLLAQELDPSIVCVAIKACPKDGIRRQPEAFVADVKLSKCDTCTTVVDYVEKILQSKPNDKEISKLIENVCKAVPKNMQSDCASLVDLYGPYLLDAIGNIGNSHEICKSKLLGAKQCTEGPSYWCGTPEQAASCNAQEYCKKKVWKQ
ncbi:saposin, putative [Ixodes scapularis]|uniref:Saposin, putative n=1 Tax=Ixodes scapularis TaxID=6945 RepID=B7Q6Z1_IXOSC|nr:saposin, putative [Ixodes scapularis]|eukprot:XP_002412058.1 saposin, putative [Ixodes scapularis]